MKSIERQLVFTLYVVKRRNPRFIHALLPHLTLAEIKRVTAGLRREATGKVNRTLGQASESRKLKVL